jgi:stage V sporulation protein D (sporulation-specific penicillin-binding protein)
VLVLVDAPQGYPYFGGWVAAPVFKEVVKDTLRYLGLPYQMPLQNSSSSRPEDKASQGVTVPDVVGLSVAQGEKEIVKSGLIPIVEGEGERVWGQTPPGSTQVNSKSRILLYTGPTQERNDDKQEVTVPDLSGKTIREAGEILGALGLRINTDGSGVAIKQDANPGTVVKEGTFINVEFQP